MEDSIDISWRMRLPDQRQAEIAKNTLDVDEEYNKEIIDRWLTVEGEKLTVHYKTGKENAKILRTAITAFIVNLKLVLQTLKEFGN